MLAHAFCRRRRATGGKIPHNPFGLSFVLFTQLRLFWISWSNLSAAFLSAASFLIPKKWHPLSVFYRRLSVHSDRVERTTEIAGDRVAHGRRKI